MARCQALSRFLQDLKFYFLDNFDLLQQVIINNFINSIRHYLRPVQCVATQGCHIPYQPACFIDIIRHVLISLIFCVYYECVLFLIRPHARLLNVSQYEHLYAKCPRNKSITFLGITEFVFVILILGNNGKMYSQNFGFFLQFND